MNYQGKVWGTTEALFCRNNVEMHRIHAIKGGYCSKHYHAAKYNAFYVIRGTLKISIWKGEYSLVDVTILRAGQGTIVKPGDYHTFEALTTVDAMEIYWVELSESDITRENVGGMR